jgi:uncharacterized protein (TIGR04255 family)
MLFEILHIEIRQMAEIRALKNPPIIEALFDLRFVPSEARPLSMFEDLARSIAGVDSEVQRLESVEALLAKGPKDGRMSFTAKPSQVDGFIATNKLANRIVTVGRDKLTVGQRAPYDGWDAAFGTMARAFDLYTAAVHPLSVKRVAARFINQIEIPLERFDLDDYLLWSLGMPESFPWAAVEYNHRTVIHNETDNLLAIVILRDGKQPAQGSRMIIDIDVISGTKLDPTVSAVSKVFASIRAFKNSIFFGMVTERALERYE